MSEQDIAADYQRMFELGDELDRLTRRLDLGDGGYMRTALGVHNTGHANLSAACAEFEDHWAFGRDQIRTALTKLTGFLSDAANEYAEADAQGAIDFATVGMSDAQEAEFRAQVEAQSEPPRPMEF